MKFPQQVFICSIVIVAMASTLVSSHNLIERQPSNDEILFIFCSYFSAIFVSLLILTHIELSVALSKSYSRFIDFSF